MRCQARSRAGGSLLVSVLLALLSPGAVFPASGATAALPEDRLLEEVRFDATNGRFLMAIPIDSPWSHWTLGNPPRIIVDLGGTRSRLPNAPGLYEKLLSQGVVKSFRTSQHVNSPLDRRVRLTLELSKIVPYEARRVGNEIQIVIPEGEAASHWSTSVKGDGSAPPPASPPSHVSPPPPAHAEAHHDVPEPAKAARPFTPSPLLPPDDELASAEQAADVAHDVVRQLEANGLAATGSAGSLRPPTHAEPPHESPPPNATSHESTTHEAASHAVEPAPKASAIPKKPSHAKPSSATQSKDVRSLRAALEEAVGSDNVRDLNQDREAPSAVRTEHEIDPPDHEEIEPDEEGEDSEAHGEEDAHVVPAAHDAHASAEPVAHPPEHEEGSDAAPTEDESSADEDPPPVPVSEMHERNAQKSYAEALKRYLRGESTAAIKYCRRARKYYPESDATAHASLLLREIWILNGNDVEADQLTGLPASPDSSWMPIDVLTRLLGGHKRQKNWLELERLLREWGPYYALEEQLPELHWDLAQAFLEQKKRDAARTHLLEIPEAHPLGPRALLLLAQMSEDEGARADAAELYRRLSYLETSVWQQRGLARTADLSFQAGEIAGSLESYEALLESRPPPDEEVWAVFQVANCLLLLGDLAGAKLRYETVSTRWPKSYWAPFAQERLEAMAWNRDLSKRIEATAKP